MFASMSLAPPSCALWPVLVVLVMVPLWRGCEAQILPNCEGTDGCRCKFKDGSGVIDVSSLGNTDGTPRFKDILATDGSGFYYSFNPCFSFQEITCSNAAACQIEQNKVNSFQIGDTATATWSTQGPDLGLTYTSYRDVLRTTHVVYTCDQTATTPTIMALGESPMRTYTLLVTSKCACKNACKAQSGGTSEPLLSIGSIIVIVFFAMLLVYFIAGIVFNRTRRQATGVEMVPNVTFWQALPGLIKDGFCFVVNKARRKSGTYEKLVCRSMSVMSSVDADVHY